MARFRKDFDSDRIKKKVGADKAEGDARKVQGTPTFFVNGKEYSGDEIARGARVVKIFNALRDHGLL
jgi:protein-disulfide isomerase